MKIHFDKNFITDSSNKPAIVMYHHIIYDTYNAKSQTTLFSVAPLRHLAANNYMHFYVLTVTRFSSGNEIQIFLASAQLN